MFVEYNTNLLKSVVRNIRPDIVGVQFLVVGMINITDYVRSGVLPFFSYYDQRSFFLDQVHIVPL